MHAFEESEAKNIATLASNLLIEKSSPKIFTFVAVLDDVIVGHIAFSPVILNSDNNLTGYILAPLGVKPDYQKHSIGTKLINNGIELLSKAGINVLFVYGDPKYYSKFGFNQKIAAPYSPPYKLQYPFGWLALVLNETTNPKNRIKVSCVESLCNPILW